MRKVLLASLTICGALMLSCSPEKMPEGKPSSSTTTVDGDAISANMTSLSFTAEGGFESVSITSNFSWEVISTPSWITLSKTSGSSGTTGVTVTAAASTSTSSRTGTISIGKSSAATVSISVSQSAASSGGGSSETITVNGVSFKMIKVEGGTFTMGATAEQGNDPDIPYIDEEKPTHSVTLSSYSIGETEVTQELWEAVLNNNISHFKSATKPVECVSWTDCQEFITKLNSMTGRTFRLPTEAEWEYAARGGKKSQGFKYSGSNIADDVAWYGRWGDNNGNSNGETHTVATKKANELGIYDMSGNVYEWCSDWYDSYSGNSQTNPTGPSSGSKRVLRGGDWGEGSTYTRVSSRFKEDPQIRYDYLGLRLAL